MKEFDYRGKTVLVIEDKRDWRTRFTDLCLRMELNPIVAKNVDEARAAFKEKQFDLVLLDLSLTEGDFEGFDLLQLLQADEQLNSIPVIVITTYEKPEFIVRCLALGAADFIEKSHPEVVIEARMRNSLIGSMKSQRIKDILHTVLPHQISNKLIKEIEIKPERKNNVAVLFTDIKGFTKSCIDRDPAEVFDQLRRMFTGFEKLATKHKVEKIKTIGDAFMGTCGLLDPHDDSVFRCFEFGKEAIAMAKELGLETRVGINFGPVMAGFLGEERLQYDLLGNTVNLAQRAESVAIPGCLCLTEEAYRAIEHLYPGKQPELKQPKGFEEKFPYYDFCETEEPPKEG